MRETDDVKPIIALHISCCSQKPIKDVVNWSFKNMALLINVWYPNTLLTNLCGYYLLHVKLLSSRPIVNLFEAMACVKFDIVIC